MSDALPSRAWKDSFESRMFQGYIAGLKSYWGGELYRQVVSDASSLTVSEVDELELAMKSYAAYRLYAWLERRLQQIKWNGRWGFSTLVTEQKKVLEGLIAQMPTDAYGKLVLNSDFKIPDYVRETSTHQQKGGLWSDASNAYALAWYTTGLSFSGTNPDELVNWYAGLVKKVCANYGLVPQSIIDMGCTGGRSTRAIKRALPEADLIGCDVCDGPLRHGYLRSSEERCAVTLAQWSAEHLGVTDQSTDVVTSHWLYHEMPPSAIKASIAEARRVLKPGGLFLAYDMFIVPGGLVGKWLHSGYAARNNEPFAHTLMNFDFKKELESLGFKNIKIELTSPQYSSLDVPEKLPPKRLHYMSFISARME